jgi:hypothetical protein
VITQSPSATPKPEAWREDPDMLSAPIALLRAAKKAKLLAEQTGTPYIIRERSESVDAVQAAVGVPPALDQQDFARHTG